MSKVFEIPPWNSIWTKLFRSIGGSKYSHSHNSKYVDYNSKNASDIEDGVNTMCNGSY